MNIENGGTASSNSLGCLVAMLGTSLGTVPLVQQAIALAGTVPVAKESFIFASLNPLIRK